MRKTFAGGVLFVLGIFFHVHTSNFLFNQGQVYCQNLPCQGKGNLAFTTDINFFQGYQGKTKVEIYYLIQLKDLQFTPVRDTLTASFSNQLTITDSSNQIIATKSTTHSATARSATETLQETKMVVDQSDYYLSPGNYKISHKITDLVSTHSGLCDFSIKVIPFDTKTLAMSDIQLASIIKVDTSTNKFIKNNHYIFPNPARRFIYSLSYLYFYFEIYNLVPQDSGFANTFNLSYSISGMESGSIIQYPPTDVRKPGNSYVKVQAIDIRSLEIGDYRLHVTVKDNFSNQEVSATKTFAVDKPGQATRVLPMTEADIHRYRDQIKYFATRAELELFDQLDSQGKESFLLEFWRSRDTSPETPENEFMQNCFSRIHYANTHFKGKENGLNSDMGRIFVIYGQPDDIENHTMELDKKPYIIWHYFTSGSGKHSFVFVDRSNIGIYSLVHSTVESEIKNEQWRERELR